jgi:L,D-transpeptidase catalytic domain
MKRPAGAKIEKLTLWISQFLRSLYQCLMSGNSSLTGSSFRGGNVKTLIRLFLAIGAAFWVGVAMAAETRMIINLSEQMAYLVEHSKVTLISPIASGKPGWQTPTGNFTIFSKDIDHHSRSFGSVIDASGRMINPKCNSRQLRSPGRTLSTRTDAVLHGIQLGGRYARRLSSGISRIPRLRPDA